MHPETCRLFALVSAGYVKIATLAADDLLIRDPSSAVSPCCSASADAGSPARRPQRPSTSKLNQQGLATLSNLARTTTGAILRQLEELGHVEVSYRHIRILAPDALRAMLVE